MTIDDLYLEGVKVNVAFCSKVKNYYIIFGSERGWEEDHIKQSSRITKKSKCLYQHLHRDEMLSSLCLTPILRHHYVKYSHYGKSNFVYLLIMDSH